MILRICLFADCHNKPPPQPIPPRAFRFFATLTGLHAL